MNDVTTGCRICIKFKIQKSNKKTLKLLGMCGMDFTTSVRFSQKPRVRFGFIFLKNRRFGFLCRLVVKYRKKCVSCLSCVCILHFGRRFSKCSTGLKRMFLKFNLNINLNHIVFLYMMPIMPLFCLVL